MNFLLLRMIEQVYRHSVTGMQGAKVVLANLRGPIWKGPAITLHSPPCSDNLQDTRTTAWMQEVGRSRKPEPRAVYSYSEGP